jgi:integrase
MEKLDLHRSTVDLRADIDDARRLKPRSKVPLTPDAKFALEHAISLSSSPYVISWAGKPVRSIKTAFARAAAAARLPHATVHMLRHSAAVHMAEAGVSLDKIAKYLAHSDPRVTHSIYLKYTPGYLADAAAALTRQR